MDSIKVEIKASNGAINNDSLKSIEQQIGVCHKILHDKSGEGNDYLGWIDAPINYDKVEFARIKATADKIKSDSDVLLVIGIGGSYLGARAAIEALNHSFYNQLSKEERKTPEIYYIGNSISAAYILNLLDIIKGKEISVNIISKSGTTTEPAIAFRIMKQYMEDKYGKEIAAKRIYATTDKSRGALKRLAAEEGYETFVIPDDIGGRYSVLTAVGLLPIAVSGADIDKMMLGALDGFKEYSNGDATSNECYKYAALRNMFHRDGKNIEIMVNYEPSMHFFAEWWKQLFGESEGKDQKGIFPAAVDFTTDLHSMGQYIQDGLRIMFETVIRIEKPSLNFDIPNDNANLDGLNFISGRDLDYVNKKALEGTVLAHNDGGVSNILLSIPAMDEYNLGKLIYFFEKACGISGYLLKVNPFNQPGVEDYKRNMFALLDKPGYEEEKKILEGRLLL